MPASARVSGLTSLPAANPARRSRLSSLYSTWVGGVKPSPRMNGRLRKIGSPPDRYRWPVSPVRAPWPLVPRPPVLPAPAEMPRPLRLRSFLAPSFGLSSCSFMIPPVLRYFFNLDQMVDLGKHAAQRRRVGLLNHLVQSVEAQGAQGGLMGHGIADGALEQGDA